MRLNLHLDLLVDSDDDDGSDNDNDEMIEEDSDIIQEALRIAWELNAQKSTTWVPNVLMICSAWPRATLTARPWRAGSSCTDAITFYPF